MERKPWEHRPLWMCQQTTNTWRMEKWTMSKTQCLIDRSARTFNRNHMECNWSVYRTSQRPHIDFHVSVMATLAGFGLPAYVTTLLFLGHTLMSRLGLCLFTTSQQEGFTVLTHFHIYIFRIYSSPRNHWEAVICIYIRSLDQARGLLAQGMLVFSSVVSSDSQHVSSGNLCTACIRQLSLSTSKLSCLSLVFSLFISVFSF